MRTAHLRHKSIQTMASEAINAYFQPLLYFVSLFDKSISIDRKNHELQSKCITNQNTLRAIHKAVCFNQGEYLQYTFITAEKHRKLKDTYRTEPDNLTLLSQLTKELTDYINKQFYEDVYENFKILHAYFNRRGKRNPRICIKGNFRVSDKDKIVSIFRDRSVGYDSDAEVEKNYGFLSVYKNGTYYLENNIPKAVLEDRYFNPRLNSEFAKKQLPNKGNVPAKLWKNCWIGDKTDEASFYKSTLIIPMTLWNNKLSDEFKKLINLTNVERTIFGFICFDHIDEDYFDKENDISVGYVFADIISMYIFTRLIYMEISKTFSDVEKRLSEDNIEVKVESLSSVWKNIPSMKQLDTDFKIIYKKSQSNSLFPMDSDLLKYIQSITSTLKI